MTTGTILASSSNPALPGTSVTFTATVTGSSPTGTVTFMDGASSLGSAELAGGRATYTDSSLSAGIHPITAVYGGDAENLASSSFVLQQSVNIYSGVIAIAAGSDHAVALKSDGSVAAWGRNLEGQTTVPSSEAIGVIAIAAGGYHTVALKSDGSVIAWGDNYYGQATIPASATSGVVAIGAGASHTVALKSDGSVIAWGSDSYGQATIPASATSGVIAMAAGGYHTVALKSDGSVIAWGGNSYGQTTVPASATSGVVAIAAGKRHTLALKADGSVIAWGCNTYGQATIPASATSGVIAIAAGVDHTAALKADGSVIAWGGNSYGQTTIPASATSGVIAIAAGDYYTVALKNNGTVIAWGMSGWDLTAVPYNTVTINPSGPVPPGQTVAISGDWGGINCLWDGLTASVGCVSESIIDATRLELTASLPPNTFIDTWGTGCDEITATTCTINSIAADATISPVTIVGIVPPDAPVIGSATAGDIEATVSFTPPASNGGGTIWWYTITSSGGEAVFGTSSPIVVTGLTNGTSYTFTVTATNGAGRGPASEASNSVTPKRATSTILASLSNPALYGTPVTFTATVTGSGPITFMDGASVLGSAPLSGGRATYGTSSLSAGIHPIAAIYGGDAVNAGSTSVILLQSVSTYLGVIAIAAGSDHTVALKSDGSVVAWGDNSDGQTTIPSAATSGVVAIAAGDYHTAALKSDGSVIAWGSNSSGQTTIPASATSGVIAIAAGGVHTVALKSDGSVVAWGSNSWGQTTIPASATTGVVAIAAGGIYTVALRGDGSVIAWGNNEYGQTTIPAAVTSGVVAIDAGALHTVVLKSDGSVIAWGYNAFGQTTVPASAKSGVVAIAAGGVHTVALKSDGSVIAWGYNVVGQTTVPASATSGVIAIAAGLYHTVALKSDGSVIAWGSDMYGQSTVPSFTVTVNPTGMVEPGGTATITGNANGIDCVWDGTSSSGSCVSVNLIKSTMVELTASLPPHTFIGSWSGCDTRVGNRCFLTLNSNRTVGVLFAAPSVTLTVARTGSGEVSPDTGSLSWEGSTGSGTYPWNTQVTLTPAPAEGWVFSHWTGACTGSGDCTILLMQDRAVGAVFTVTTRALTVTTSGTGTVTPSTGALFWTGSTGTADYDYGTPVTLHAAAGEGYEFIGWSGDCAGSGDCTLSMSADRTVGAVFSLLVHRLTVTLTGSGEVTADTGSLTFEGATGTADYDHGTVVTLHAAPSSGSQFIGWSGACVGTGDCLLSMTSDLGVGARFNRPPTLDEVAARELAEGDLLTFALSAADPDGDHLVYSLVSGPAGAGVDPETGVFTWTPWWDASGLYNSVRVEVTDGAEAAWREFSITVTDTVNPPLVEEHFTQGRGADPEWMVTPPRSWAVNTIGKYVSRPAMDGFALAKAVDPVSSPFGAGRISAKMRLTSSSAYRVNAALVFAWQDSSNYRYVRLRPGKVIIGQVGILGGQAAGTWGVRRPVAADQANFVTVDVWPDGSVDVYITSGGVSMKRCSQAFNETVPGMVGVWAREAKSLVDDIFVWDESALFSE